MEPNNSYRAVIQGALPTEYESQKEAQDAAAMDAKKRLDELLDEH
jgi:hypothetical protein